MKGLSEQHRWFVGLWLGCALLMLGFAVNAAVHHDHGVTAACALLAAFYVCAAGMFIKINRRPQ